MIYDLSSTCRHFILLNSGLQIFPVYKWELWPIIINSNVCACSPRLYIISFPSIRRRTLTPLQVQAGWSGFSHTCPVVLFRRAVLPISLHSQQYGRVPGSGRLFCSLLQSGCWMCPASPVEQSLLTPDMIIVQIAHSRADLLQQFDYTHRPVGMNNIYESISSQ